MYLFCPTCQTQFPAAGRCPRCSSRLLSPGEAVETQRANRPPSKPPAMTFGGRVAVGCVIALGAHLGLREWSMAFLNSVDAAATVVFIVGVLLRLASGFVGGAFAGAGRENAFGGGLAVGVASGFAWLFIDPYPDVTIDLVHVGLTGLIAIVAGVAALVGHRVWPPAIVLEEPEDSRGSSLLKFMPAGPKVEKSRPTHWWKVVLSSFLVLAAVVASDYARQGLRKMPTGLLNNFGGTGSGIPRVDFEIAVFGIIFGAVIAGLNTGSGLRHGLLSGSITAFAVVMMYRSQGEGAFPALDFLAEHLESDTPGKLALALGSIFFLTGVVGGWMGGQLMPPLRRKRKLKAPG